MVEPADASTGARLTAAREQVERALRDARADLDAHRELAERTPWQPAADPAAERWRQEAERFRELVGLPPVAPNAPAPTPPRTQPDPDDDFGDEGVLYRA